VIIEDGAFVGSRCVVFHGVRVGREAVLGANVVLTKTNPTIVVHRLRAETSAEALAGQQSLTVRGISLASPFAWRLMCF
jgi:tetrahydrodipicolinate N-succinyltransferase